MATLEIPNRTYIKAFVVFLIVSLIIKLAPVFLLIFLAVLVAVTLHSLECFLVSKGWKKSLADIFLILALISTLSVIFFYIIPLALDQMKDLLKDLPRLEKEMAAVAPTMITKNASKIFNNSPEALSRMWDQFAVIANQTLDSLFKFTMIIITSIYMFLDGRRGYDWLLAFFSEEHRVRIDKTAKEITPIVESYIIGQATTSTIAAIWVFAVASYLDVPGAITLAVLAAVFDILPGIGFILNVVTAGLLGLTVSTHTASLMVLALMLYSAIENYVLIPHIYGKRMKLSPLVVLLSLIVSGAAAGLPGMIAVLPIVAAYEPIEKLWLKRKAFMAETVRLHEQSNESS